MMMRLLEQYVSCVLNYSSKYNTTVSRSYAPENVIGKCEKYPAYGDFLETYMLRSYGKWIKESEAYQQEYMTNDVDPLGAEDYITLRFEDEVIPKEIYIYETYNPGAVVRIWGRLCGGRWRLLWEGEPQICPDEARKFSPCIKYTNELINEVRLEFNQSHLRYHTAIDAVLLTGYFIQTPLQRAIYDKGLLFNFANRGIGDDNDDSVDESSSDVPSKPDFLSQLPYEVLLHIFEYLDIKSLCRCAQVNRRFYQISLDPTLYQRLSLKRYWNKVDDTTLELFQMRCRNLKKLDLSWCGNDIKHIFAEKFIVFLKECCQSLTHLALNNCEFVNNRVIEALVDCSELVELRLRCCPLDRWRFAWISHLTNLVTLDLYSTAINENVLIPIVRGNPNLKHIILDSCENLRNMDEVVRAVSESNLGLVSWSSWKTHSLTAVGAGYFGRCANLRELDLGWCLVLVEPGDCLHLIAAGCPNLRRLVISGWRGVKDRDLLPIIDSCKDLTQLDFLGLTYLSGELCERALTSLPKLQLLDISFCDRIKLEQVEVWRQIYPKVTIQRSCQYGLTDSLSGLY